MPPSGAQVHWPQLEDGRFINGPVLFHLIQNFRPVPPIWDLRAVVEEVEDKFGAHLKAITLYACGRVNQVLWCDLTNGEEIVIRLGHSDVKKPVLGDTLVEKQLSNAAFENALYEIFRRESPEIKVASLLYSRGPQYVPFSSGRDPSNIMGRRLCVFEAPEGISDAWSTYDGDGKAELVTKAAHMRAALFNFKPRRDFVERFLPERLQNCGRRLRFSDPVAPTREFCMALLLAKIHATIPIYGEPLGGAEVYDKKEDDDDDSDSDMEVGHWAATAKSLFLDLVPHILPHETNPGIFYRFVIEHADYSIWNMTSTHGEDGKPTITSLYGWDTAYIVPAIFSNPKFGVAWDLDSEDQEKIHFYHLSPDSRCNPRPRRHQFVSFCRLYKAALFNKTPAYQTILHDAKDARYLWHALCNWSKSGVHPEVYFKDLCNWAEKKLDNIQGVS